jgi:hypothetical protein
MRGQVITIGAWVLFAGLLLYVKDRREKAYWKEVTDKIIVQMEPPKGEGLQPLEAEASFAEFQSDAEIAHFPPPTGVHAAGGEVASEPSRQDELERFARKLGVLP